MAHCRNCGAAYLPGLTSCFLCAMPQLPAVAVSEPSGERRTFDGHDLGPARTLFANGNVTKDLLVSKDGAAVLIEYHYPKRFTVEYRDFDRGYLARELPRLQAGEYSA